MEFDKIISQLLFESQFDKYFDYFGGSELDFNTISGGLYPGVSGKDAVKNMILDVWLNEMYEDGPYIAQAIDTLTDKQLLDLICINYDGSPLADMPSWINELSANSDGDYFCAPDVSATLQTFEQAIQYFKGDYKNYDLPQWAQNRQDALEMREKLVRKKRKEI